MLTVRSTTYSSPTAVLSRRWRFTRTAASLRWQHRQRGLYGGAGRRRRRDLLDPAARPGGRDATKISRMTFNRAMSSMPAFRTLMYSHLQAFLEQVLVSVACNGAHRLKQRLARWLLMMRDRSDDDTLEITQSLLAEMLGVHRPTVSNAARELERTGLIARNRRHITIVDRQGLAEASCECYQLVRARLTFHLPKTYA